MLAYVLMSLNGGDELQVLDKLRAIQGVIDAHVLFGEWDLIAKIDMESSENFSSLVMDQIRKWPEVKQTSSMIVAK